MKNNQYIFFFIILLVLSACNDMVQEIEWETGDAEITLNVEGRISTDFIHHEVMLKSTQDYFYNKPLPAVSNAQVSVTDGETTYNYYESDTAGLYKSEIAFKGEAEKTYTLVIDLESSLGGTTHYEAETYIYENFEIYTSFASYIYYPLWEGMDSNFVLIGVSASDPYIGEENYYYYKIYKGDSIVTDTLDKYEIFSDAYQEDSLLHVYYAYRWYNFKAGDTLVLEAYSITKDYYSFLEGLLNIMYPMDPMGLSGSPARVDGNINDGQGFGYFYGTDIIRDTIIVDDNY